MYKSRRDGFSVNWLMFWFFLISLLFGGAGLGLFLIMALGWLAYESAQNG